MDSPKKIRSTEIYNENFNHYFTEQLNSMTPEQKLRLPNDLSFKIYTRGNEASAEKLNFNEKVWILSVVFEKEWTLTVHDKDAGLDMENFITSIKVQRGAKLNGELLEGLRVKSFFALGGKEVMASLLYMAQVSCTGIYQLVKKHIPNADHAKNKKFVDQRTEFLKVLTFIKNYEAKKNRIAENYSLTMPEWYCLVYFSINEGFAKDFYNHEFTYAYNSNRRTLHSGMLNLYKRGLLTKRQSGKSDKYTTSAKGLDLLDRIFNNILLKI